MEDCYRTFCYWYNRWLTGFRGHAACDVGIVHDNAQIVYYWTKDDSREHQNYHEVLRVYKEIEFRVALNGADTTSMVHLHILTPKINRHDAKLLVQLGRMTVEWLFFVCGLVPLPRAEETKAYLYARSAAWIWIKAWYNDIDWYCMRGWGKKYVINNIVQQRLFFPALSTC